MNPFSNPIFLSLNREAELSVRLICDGINALRKANRAPDTYSALFSITIGVERLGKLAILLDRFFANNGEFPSDRELRRIGHDIDALSKELVSIANNRNIEKAEISIFDETISKRITTCLSDFAKGSRYYNLDRLVGSTKANNSDPIVKWREEVGQLVLNTHYPKWRREKDFQQAASLGSALDGVSFTMGIAQDNTLIDSQVEAIRISKENRYLKKWVPYYILRIVRLSSPKMILKRLLPRSSTRLDLRI
jgi:hypothetical protein